jgi:chemotaxis signal transduction protein
MSVDTIAAFVERVAAEAVPVAPAPVEPELHLVVFQLGAEHFAVPIASVREVVRVPGITRVPHAPAEIRGVMNLRGRILPVVEVRSCLGLPPAEPGPRSRVVVVEVRGRQLGLLVDQVGQVTRVGAGQVAPAPEEVRGARAVTGMARQGDRLLLLLELERLLHHEG